MCAEVHCMTSTSKIISKMMPTDSCVSSRRPVMTHPDAWNFVFSVLAPIPRYGYQPVWEVKRVKHLTRRVALHRTTHRAKLAKLETFVSFVSQLAQLLSCSSCCWAWWSLVEVPLDLHRRIPLNKILVFSLLRERVTDYYGSGPSDRCFVYHYCIGWKGS